MTQVFEIALLAKHTSKQNHALLDHACTIIAHILFDGRERERKRVVVQIELRKKGKMNKNLE